MNRDIKFTTDGKKVVVIGSLNTQEKIVQEVFIVDGSEIPSGEHFVVKSLHDKPAVSWKESELIKLEERYNKEKAEYQREIDANYKRYKDKTNEFRKKFEYIASALKNADERSFDTLIDFITGEIKWIVVDKYEPELTPIDKFHIMYEDKLRLFSLFGKDDGTFTYSVGDYYDYSGSHKKFHPFKNYDDALNKFSELILGKDISESNIKTARQYNIVIPDDKIIAFKNKKVNELNKCIESQNGQIQKIKDQIEQINNI